MPELVLDTLVVWVEFPVNLLNVWVGIEFPLNSSIIDAKSPSLKDPSPRDTTGDGVVRRGWLSETILSKVMFLESSRRIWSNWEVGLSTPENVSNRAVNRGELVSELKDVGDNSSPGAGDRGRFGGLSEELDRGEDSESRSGCDEDTLPTCGLVESPSVSSSSSTSGMSWRVKLCNKEVLVLLGDVHCRSPSPISSTWQVLVPSSPSPSERSSMFVIMLSSSELAMLDRDLPSNTSSTWLTFTVLWLPW